MNRLIVALLAGIALIATAHADMYQDASNAVLPDARTNLAIAPHVATNAALLAAATTAYPTGVWRDDFATGNGAPPLWYRPSGSACPLNGGNGDNGSQVKSADGKCWLAQFPASGVDVREFGADATGATDAAPAVRAAFALGSNHVFVFGPGTYTCKSFAAAPPYPLITPNQCFTLYGTAGAPVSNVQVIGYGATLTADSGHGNSNFMSFDYVNNLILQGLSFGAVPAAWPANSEPSALYLTHIVNGRVQDIALTGNWGGNTRQPSAVVGDWLTDMVFDHLDMPQQSSCFDLAFLRRVSFHHIMAVGAADSGNPSSGGNCWGIGYDGDFATKYPAAVTFSKTDHVDIDGSNKVSFFSSGVFIRGGSTYSLGLSSYNNSIYGIVLVNDINTCCASVNDPVTDVTIAGANLAGNALGGLVIDGRNQTGTEVIADVIIINSTFNANTPVGISTLGAHVKPGTLFFGPNAFYGAGQTTSIDCTTLTFAGAFVAFKSTPTAGFNFACKPAAPAMGMLVFFNDANVNTWGSAITAGGGSNGVLALYNSLNWTVVAK